jgi:hypothetical protein
LGNKTSEGHTAAKGKVTNRGEGKVEFILEERVELCGTSESIKGGQADLEIEFFSQIEELTE